MKKAVFSMVMFTFFFGKLNAQTDRLEVNADSAILILSVKDGRVNSPAAFHSLLNEAGEPISVTDINGRATLKSGIFVTVRSFFSKDTSFIVPVQREFTVMITPKIIDLQEVEVTSYTVEKLMTLAGRGFSTAYPTSPLLYHVNAYSYIKDRKNFLEFYQMDGLALLSGLRKWSKWSFAPGGKPDSYFFLIPMEQRMSDRLDYNGDPISYVSYTETGATRWVLLPFMSRPVYRGLEICGPMFYKNRRYYEFAYNYDEETDEYYAVQFKTKEKYRRENSKNIFLIGEGSLVIAKSNLRIVEVAFEFSQYHDVNFETNRTGRRKEVAGEILVQYNNSGVIRPSEFEFTCYYLGENWFSPREDPVGNGIVRYEKVIFGHHGDDLMKEDLPGTVRSFAFVGMNSQAEYDSDFWLKEKQVPGSLYGEISRALSARVPLEKQYLNNSGKRWEEWDRSRSTPQRVFSDAESFEEAVNKYERLVKQIRENQFRDMYDYLRAKEDEKN